MGRTNGFLLDEPTFESLLRACHLELIEERATNAAGIVHAILDEDAAPVDGARAPLRGQRLNPQDIRDKPLRRPRTQLPPNNDRDLYAQLCTARLGEVKTDLSRRAEREQRAVAELRRQLVDATRAATETQDRLDALQAGRSEELSRFGDEFDALMSHPRVEHVKVDGNTIQIFTKLILVQDPRDNVWRRIGKFRINLAGGSEASVVWHNLDGAVTTGGSHTMFAPHVTSSGIPCWGNTRELFADTLAQFEYLQAAGIAIRFVEKVNIDDQWGKQVHKWPAATAAEIKAFTEAVTNA